MDRAPSSRRFGRRAAILAAIGAAAVASLAMPYGIRFCQETYAIHQLGSADEARVKDAIATLVRLRSERGAKRIFEFTARNRPMGTETVASVWEAFLSPSLTEDWVLQKAQSPMMEERLLAVTIIGEKKIAGGLPILRKIASDEDDVSPSAFVALAQILPTLKLLRTETTKTGVKATFRFENLTGHRLWYYGITVGSPYLYKVVGGKVQWYSTTIGNNMQFEPGHSIEVEQDFEWKELPASLAVTVQGDDGGKSHIGTVRSDPVERPRSN